MNEQPMLPGMPADQPQQNAGPPNREDSTTGGGFSTSEKLIGAATAYRAPLASSLAASAMLRHESDPTRRRQLSTLRSASLIWWGVGAVVTIIGLVVVLSFAASQDMGDGCKGGPDKFAAEQITYRSIDEVHWTATYPCTESGYTTVPIAKSALPIEVP
jgi:hypothetical protein